MLHEITAILSKSDFRIKALIGAGLITLVSLEWLLHTWQASAMRKGVETSIESVNYVPREILDLNDAPAETTDSEELTNRPLFNKGRKTFVEAAEVPEVNNEVQSLELDEWNLVGIYLKNNQQHALFTNKNIPKKHLKLLLNDSIGSWKLTEIASNQVIFEQRQEQRILALRKAKSGSASASTVNPSASQTVKKSLDAKPVPPQSNPAVDATAEEFVAPNIPEPENNNENE